MRNSRAFTLIELIVAISVTTLIVAAMMRLFMDETTLWQRYDQKLDTFREARAAMQMMARDFGGLRPESSALSTDPNQKFPMLALVANPEGKPEDQVNQEIYGLPSVRNKGANDLCAIGYYCTWSDAKNAFVLQRQFTDSSTTFGLLTNALDVNHPTYGAEAFGIIFTRDTKKNTGLTIDDLASYIWDLKVVTPLTGNPPTQLSWPQGYFDRELPPWVEISFKAVGINAARKIAGSGVTRDTWFQPQSTLYRNLILPNEQQFVTRIKLCR